MGRERRWIRKGRRGRREGLGEEMIGKERRRMIGNEKRRRV